MPFPLLDDDDWDQLMELNVNAVFRLSRAAARGMIRRKYGRIVNIGIIAGDRSIASPVHYATSKAALEGMTRALAHQLGPYGILVNCIAAGISRGASAGPSPSTTRSATSTRARSAGSDSRRSAASWWPGWAPLATATSTARW